MKKIGLLNIIGGILSLFIITIMSIEMFITLDVELVRLIQIIDFCICIFFLTEFKNNFFLSIIKFFCYIKDAIISRDEIYNESDIVIKRQVNPDMEVYRYKNTTNLNMRYSKNSYALLFDK